MTPRELAQRLGIERHVFLDTDQAMKVTKALTETVLEPRLPTWQWPPYLQSDAVEEVLRYLLVLNAINYCFTDAVSGIRFAGYQVPGDDSTKRMEGATLLAARLTEFWADFRDPEFLTNLTPATLLGRYVFGDEGPIPLANCRAAMLQEVGFFLDQPMKAYWGTIEAMVRRAPNGRVVAENLAKDLPGTFGQDPFLKRGQLFAQMAAGVLEGQTEKPLYHSWLTELTVPADYRVPQALQRLGILHYGPGLYGAVREGMEIPADSAWELELRAATIKAVDYMAVCAGPGWTVAHLDELLWKFGRGGSLPGIPEETLPKGLPHHITTTTHY